MWLRLQSGQCVGSPIRPCVTASESAGPCPWVLPARSCTSCQPTALIELLVLVLRMQRTIVSMSLVIPVPRNLTARMREGERERERENG